MAGAIQTLEEIAADEPRVAAALGQYLEQAGRPADAAKAYASALEVTPMSAEIKVVERFTPNADYTRLDYRLTTTDPVNFERPFDLTRYYLWKPENVVHPYECLDRF